VGLIKDSKVHKEKSMKWLQKSYHFFNPIITIVEEEIEKDKIHSIEDRLYMVQKVILNHKAKHGAYIAPI